MKLFQENRKEDMINISIREFVKKDKMGRVRYKRLELMKSPESDNEYQEIYRYNGILGGKESIQEVILIDAGKQQRSVAEQALLKFNSIISSICREGYKEVQNKKGLKNLDDVEVARVMSTLMDSATDSKGVLKPMLAFKPDFNSEKDLKKMEQTWYASRKLDGARCLLYFQDGMILSSSRGGKDFNVATEHIRFDKDTIKFFEKNPNIVLDGELYIHGMPLHQISGLVRKTSRVPAMNDLRFNCYDIVDLDKSFESRYQVLNYIKKDWGNMIDYVDHYILNNMDEVWEMHKRVVEEEGYEGVVLRDPKGKYRPAARDWRMIKIKQFDDDEFEIIGAENGFRGYRDMVFRMVNRSGSEFNCKPMGDDKLKKFYMDNIDSLIGKMATVKYFGLTKNGLPNIASLVVIRNYE